MQIPRYPVPTPNPRPLPPAAETAARRSGTQPRSLYFQVLSQVSLVHGQVSDGLIMISKGIMESGHLVLPHRQSVCGQWCFGNERLGMAKALTQECQHEAGSGHGQEENPTPLPGSLHHFSSWLACSHSLHWSCKLKKRGVFKSLPAPQAASSSCQETATHRAGARAGQTRASETVRAWKRGGRRQGGPQCRMAHFLQAKSHSR